MSLEHRATIRLHKNGLYSCSGSKKKKNAIYSCCVLEACTGRIQRQRRHQLSSHAPGNPAGTATLCLHKRQAGALFINDALHCAITRQRRAGRSAREVISRGSKKMVHGDHEERSWKQQAAVPRLSRRQTSVAGARKASVNYSKVAASRTF